MALERAKERLAAAEEELRNLGRFGRRHERVNLQAEIGLQRAAFTLARRQLEKNPLEPLEARRTRTLRARPGSAERTPSRAREQDGSLGLEL